MWEFPNKQDARAKAVLYCKSHAGGKHNPSVHLPSSLLLVPPISRTIQEPASMAVWKIGRAESQPQNHRT